MTALPEGTRPGDRVTAKRAGWDEDLTPEQYLDLEPLSEKEYPSDMLEGLLEVVEVPASAGVPALTLYRVGGQPADPRTIRPVAPDRD